MPTGQSPDRSGGGGHSEVVSFRSGPTFAGARGGTGLSPHRVCALVIRLPVRDVGVVLPPPRLYPFVHHALPQGRDHRQRRHRGVAVGQLGRGVFGVALQQREAAVGFGVVVGMALQVDQQPV